MKTAIMQIMSQKIWKYTDDEPEDMQVYRWRARWYESIQMTSQMIWKYTDDEPDDIKYTDDEPEDMKVYRWRAR